MCVSARWRPLQLLQQLVGDERPAVDRLNKTGAALLKLVGENEVAVLSDLMAAANRRFEAVRGGARKQGGELEDAYQQSSEVRGGAGRGGEGRGGANRRFEAVRGGARKQGGELEDAYQQSSEVRGGEGRGGEGRGGANRRFEAVRGGARKQGGELEDAYQQSSEVRGRGGEGREGEGRTGALRRSGAGLANRAGSWRTPTSRALR